MYIRGLFPFCTFWLWLGLTLLSLNGRGADLPMDDSLSLRMPVVGDHQLRVITPTLLELTLITTKAADPATLSQWNFVDANGTLTLPSTSQFSVSANAQSV